MTRESIKEYAEAVRERYLRSTKREKGHMPDQFVEVTGLHRKAAIRLLYRREPRSIKKKRGRPRQYRADVVAG